MIINDNVFESGGAGGALAPPELNLAKGFWFRGCSPIVFGSKRWNFPVLCIAR